MITADSIVVGIDNPLDIPFVTFQRVQDERGSPATAFAGAGYNAARMYRVSAAFLLSVFGHESQFATDPNAIVVKYATNNPGNCRSPRIGNPPIIDTPRGQFVKYATWAAGWEDLAWRLVDPDYVYAKERRRTIRQIITRFAPATDGNSPESYIAAVVRNMNTWIDEAPPMVAFEMPLSIAGIPVRKSFIPAGNSNRPGTPATAEGRQWITVHETANFNKGANAEMHRRFTHGAGGWGGGGHPATADTEEYEGVSFTFCVDDHEIVWLLPLEEKSWQASDGANGPGNSSTSIEKCVNADGDPAKTSENLAQLVGYLAMRHPEKSPDRVAQHNKWARDGKNCPAQMRANGGAGWNALMARVQELSRPGNESVRFFPETGFIVGHGFLSFWSQFSDDATSVAVFGYPLTEEIQEDGRTVQYFERSVFEYWPENPPEYTVLLRRLGADALEAA